MAPIKKIGSYSELNLNRHGAVAVVGKHLITPEILANAETSPTQVPGTVMWVFKGIVYLEDEIYGKYTNDQIQLLVFDEFDKERRRFERLKRQYKAGDEDETRTRIPIPEEVRIEVWRRDGGKCVKCGSRERLEYDHIIPVSKGGSNTARNIELLCETCNRSKGAKIT